MAPQRPTSANHLAGGGGAIQISVLLPNTQPRCLPPVRPSARPALPFSQVTSRPPTASSLRPHKGWLLQGGLRDLKGAPPLLGPAPRFTGRRRCLKSHQQHPHRPRPGPALPAPPAHPLAGCLCFHQVMCGPGALPGSDSRRMGSAEGGLGARSRSGERGGPGSGRAVPGRPPSLTKGRTRSARRLRHGSRAVALLVGTCRELGAPGSSRRLLRPQFPHL